MKTSRFILLLSLIVNLSFCQLASKTDFNLGFENTGKKEVLPDNWMVWGTKDFSVRTDSIIKHSGKNSVLIESGEYKMDNSFGSCGYKIPVKYEGSQIEVRAYLKMQNVTNGAIGLLLRIDGIAGPLKMDNMLQKNIQGTSDWTLYSIQLPLPENAKNIFIGAILSGTGKLWADDFQVLIDGVDISKAIIKKEQKIIKAEIDSEFNKSSNISTIHLTASKTRDLVVLGKVWGFLKYYHPAIAKADYNWDNELFRITPKIIQCNNEKERNQTLSKWIMNLGEIQKDSSAKKDSSSVKLYPDIEWIYDKSTLGEELSNQLRQIKNSKQPNKNYYVELATNGNPKFNEKPYNNLSNPDAGYRLLSLYRYWNIIQYYYPNRKLMDEDWNTVLKKNIPRFINAKDELEYKLAALALIAQIQDTHANIWGYDSVLEYHKGKNYAPVELSFIENKAVVTGYKQNTMGINSELKIGDIINKINGRSVSKIIKEMLPYTPASNYPTQLRNIARDLLRTNDSTMNISYTRNNSSFITSIHCIAAKKINFYSKHLKDTCFKYLSPDIAYLYPATFKNAYLPELIPQITKTKGLIIDMRCYPSDFMVYTLGNFLNSAPKEFAKASKCSIQTPGQFSFTEPMVVGTWNIKMEHYKGKVVVIVNEITQSQAEFTTMAFRASSNTVVIGSTTAGADGDVSPFFLPGGINTLISGLGIYYPDGRETQRIGIIPDIEVKPTIKGIQEGKDELLEKAIRILNKM